MDLEIGASTPEATPTPTASPLLITDQCFGSGLDSIRSVDPNLDLDWYRTYSAEMLYPDPDSINPDPKHCLGLRQTTEEKGIEEETDGREGR
jgi:hypothetical protein